MSEAATPPGARALAALAILSAGVLCTPLPGVGLQLALCAPLIALFGVPHGATDWQIAHRVLQPRLGQGWAPAFAAFYGAGMLAVWAAAAAAPAAAMLAFVGVAIWHFGAEDAGARGLPASPAAIATFGIPVVAAPALFWPGQTGALLQNLGVLQAGGPASLALAVLASLAMLIWLLAAGSTIAAHAPQRRAIILELAVLVALQAAAPPLLAFTAYFCLIHGPRHMASLPRMTGGWAVPAATLTAVFLVTAVVSAIAWRTGAGASWVTINAIFWGLAALTLPHVAFGRFAAAHLTSPQAEPFTHVTSRAAWRV